VIATLGLFATLQLVSLDAHKMPALLVHFKSDGFPTQIRLNADSVDLGAATEIRKSGDEWVARFEVPEIFDGREHDFQLSTLPLRSYSNTVYDRWPRGCGPWEPTRWQRLTAWWRNLW
jgi:hypothetical protein